MPIVSYKPQQNKKFRKASFDLYLKSREGEGVKKVLKWIAGMEHAKREAWLDENADLLEEAFDVFVADSNKVLEYIPFDPEALHLSKKLIRSIQDSASLLEDVFSDEMNIAIPSEIVN